MKAYSIDLRTKIVESVNQGVSISETARRFGVNRSTVNRYLKRLVESGSLAPKRRLGKPPKLDVGDLLPLFTELPRAKAFSETRIQLCASFYALGPGLSAVLRPDTYGSQHTM